MESQNEIGGGESSGCRAVPPAKPKYRKRPHVVQTVFVRVFVPVIATCLISTHTYIHTYIHTHIHTHIHTYTHTYIHAHWRHTCRDTHPKSILCRMYMTVIPYINSINPDIHRNPYYYYHTYIGILFCLNYCTVYTVVHDDDSCMLSSFILYTNIVQYSTVLTADSFKLPPKNSYHI